MKMYLCYLVEGKTNKEKPKQLLAQQVGNKELLRAGVLNIIFSMLTVFPHPQHV